MRVSVGLAGAVATALVIGPAAAAFGSWTGAGAATADTSQATTLYVQSPNCSDSGPGTQALPFCTLQHAADVVNPGQTIMASEIPGQLWQTVRFTRSGTPSAPITLAYWGSGMKQELQAVTGVPVPLVFDHVHDIKVSGVAVEAGNQDGIDVIGSQDITLDSLNVAMNLIPRTSTTPPAAISVDGTSSNITISRSTISAYITDGIRVAAGAAGITVTTSMIDVEQGMAVSVSGASGIDVTSNNLWASCQDAVDVAGASSAVVENNVLQLTKDASCPSTAAADLSVDATAAPRVRADYNYFSYSTVGSPYSWAGATYPNEAAFTTATGGQGSHDTVETSAGVPAGESPRIDSADCAAPGELDTDVRGFAHVDDPQVPDTGTGTCHADRGAEETEDPMALTFTQTPASGIRGVAPVAASITITSGATSPWGQAVSYAVDFGDGGGPQQVAAGATVSHAYTTPGVYAVIVTVADTGGTVGSRALQAIIGTPTAPAITLNASPAESGSPPSVIPGLWDYTISAGADNWELASGTIDPGEGGPIKIGAYRSWAYAYSSDGAYTVTVTETDLLGRTSTATATVAVGETVAPIGPYLDYNATVAAHQVVTLSWAAMHLVPNSGTDGMELNVAAASKGQAGYIIVYPHGNTRTDEAAVQFGAGQAASDSVSMLTGAGQAVDFYNGSSGPITLTVHTVGQLTRGSGDVYTPVAPSTVLSPIVLAPTHYTTFAVAGVNGVPANAGSVVLNVTESGGAAPGYFTAWPVKAANPGVPYGYWAKGQAVTSQVVVPMVDGRAAVLNSSKGSASFTATVTGYYSRFGAGSVFVPDGPLRILVVTVAGKHSVQLAVAGKNGVPATGTTAIQATVTATGASANGAVVAYADGTTHPAGFVSLNYATGATVANAATVAVGKDGKVDLYNAGSRPVTIAVDLSGSYYAYPAGS